MEGTQKESLWIVFEPVGGHQTYVPIHSIHGTEIEAQKVEEKLNSSTSCVVEVKGSHVFIEKAGKEQSQTPLNSRTSPLWAMELGEVEAEIKHREAIQKLRLLRERDAKLGSIC